MSLYNSPHLPSTNSVSLCLKYFALSVCVCLYLHLYLSLSLSLSLSFQPLTANLLRQAEALVDLDQACRASRRLQDACRDFELQKVCYVPLNVFLLRPLHRLTHYKQILERFCKHYPPTHGDFRDCRGRGGVSE